MNPGLAYLQRDRENFIFYWGQYQESNHIPLMYPWELLRVEPTDWEVTRVEEYILDLPVSDFESVVISHIPQPPVSQSVISDF